MTRDDREPDCAGTRTGDTRMPFYCHKPRGHDGDCTPYVADARDAWEVATREGVPAA